MNFSIKKLASYCINHSSTPHKVLAQLERETHLKTLAPQMISGPLQGQLLAMISKMIGPKKILEIGTFTGYASICLAQGLHENGLLTTIESNRELKSLALKFFKKAGLQDKIVYMQGDAKAIVPTLEGFFDLVFIDAGKADYTLYYELILEKINSGGIILADNTLWAGKVTNSVQDNDTKAMDAFNKLVHDDKKVEVILLPIRDGLTIIRKV